MIIGLNEESASLLEETIEKVRDTFYQNEGIKSVFMNVFMCDDLEGMETNVKKGINIVFYVILDSIDNFSMESYNAYLESISMDLPIHFYGNMVEETIFYERESLSRMDYLLSDGEILFDKTEIIRGKKKDLEDMESLFLNRVLFKTK